MADEKWLTVKDAGKYTGKAERTLRRWIQLEKIPSKKTPDGTVMVDVSGFEPADVPDAPEPEADTPEPEAAASQIEFERLQMTIERLEAENKLLADERDYLRYTLAASMETQQKLIESTTTSAGTPEDTPEGDKTRRWRWKFWQT